MTSEIEKISAVTFRVVNMTESVRFYKDVLGRELLYGGESTGFSSLCYAADSRERHLGSVITAHAVHAAPRRG